MAKQLKLRRGTTSQHSSFTGAEGEVTVDTDKETLVVHNGSTAGGFPLLRASGGSENISTTGTISSGAITAGGITSTSNMDIQNDTPSLTLNDTNSENDFRITNLNGTFILHDNDAGATRMSCTSAGQFTFATNVDFSSGVDVTGNITCTGTVDGRDVAADGSKLDGIEAGATADQTDAQIATALGSQRPTMKGATFTDDGTSDPIVNIKTDDASPWALRIGNDTHSTSNDTGLKIYQNNDGTGEFWMLSNDSNYEDFVFRLSNNAGNKQMLKFSKTNQEVELFAGGLTKFNTNSAGVNVTGNIAVSGTVDGVDIAAFKTSFDNLSTDIVSDTSPQLGGALDGQNNNVTGLANVEARRLVLLDDGASSPTLQVRTDDQSPWAVQIRNDTYWNSDSNGFKAYQDNSGNFRCNWEGNGAFINTYFQQTNGGTTNNAIHFDTNRAVHIAYQGNVKITTTSDGVDFGTAGADHTLAVSGQTVHRMGSQGSGIHFTSSAIIPTNSSGTVVDGSINLGSSSYRWANIYTSDLDLSNEAKGVNDIDGTWGHYTIVEGKSDLFLKNNRSGKTYKFNLTEVS